MRLKIRWALVDDKPERLLDTLHATNRDLYPAIYTISSVNGFFTVFILHLLLYPDVPFLYLECPFACVSGCSISLTVFSDLGALRSS
jgi:hypothetical protein